MQDTHGLDASEKEQLSRCGYVVRESVFDEDELAAIRGRCEALVARVTDVTATSAKHAFGSYLFQLGSADQCVMIKWEPDHPDVVQGLEPCAHLDQALERFGVDPRLVGPMCDVLDVPAVDLFTEKLNLKRARVGGRYVLHQDYPYWVDSAENPAEVATALVCLDAATRDNGSLEVLPGSHTEGVRRGREGRRFEQLEMDPEGFDESRLVRVEAPAGSVIYFGSLLVHRSTPNRSDTDRRALLYSYQPAGRPHSRVGLAKFFGR